jgi:predicted nucleic-acid-binding protein
MRSSAIKVINLLKKEYVTDPEIIKKLDEFINDEDIPRMRDLIKSNMKHYAKMVSDIIDNLIALKMRVPSFLMSKYFKETVDNAINEANELWEKTYNYSNEYETDSNNQVPQLD